MKIDEILINCSKTLRCQTPGPLPLDLPLDLCPCTCPWTSALGLPTRLANTIMRNSLRHYTPSLDEVSLCAQNVIVKNTE